MGLLLNHVVALVMEDAEKMELPKTFLASVFTVQTQESQAPEVRESLEKGSLPRG